MVRIFIIVCIFCIINCTTVFSQKRDILQESIDNQSYFITDGLSPRGIPIDLNVFDLEDKKNLNKNSVYNKIITCSTKDFGDKWGRPTNVHETIHVINNALSNSRRGYRAFYIGEGKAVWLQEPNIVMDDILDYIPQILRGYRFPLYFIKQKKIWNEVALYPVEEWSAYIGGAECAVDDYLRYKIDPTVFQSTKFKDLTKQRSDEVSGSLEFAIYCTALAMAVKYKDSDYWLEEEQFKKLIKYFLVKSEYIFFKGKDIFPSEKQDELLIKLQKYPESRSIRNFLNKEFDGVFIQ